MKEEKEKKTGVEEVEEDEGKLKNLCQICGKDLGSENPRQLCNKTYCGEYYKKTYYPENQVKKEIQLEKQKVKEKPKKEKEKEKYHCMKCGIELSKHSEHNQYCGGTKCLFND
jgi:hypothetical protein